MAAQTPTQAAPLMAHLTQDPILGEGDFGLELPLVGSWDICLDPAPTRITIIAPLLLDGAPLTPVDGAPVDGVARHMQPPVIGLVPPVASEAQAAPVLELALHQVSSIA